MEKGGKEWEGVSASIWRLFEKSMERKDIRQPPEGKVRCEHSDLVDSVLFVVVMMVLVFRSTAELSKSAGYEGNTSD